MGSQEKPFEHGDRSLETLNWMLSIDATGYGARVPLRALQDQYQLSMPETHKIIDESDSKGVLRVIAQCRELRTS